VEGQFGPVRDQGKRPTCLAFALSALNQAVAAAPGYLSVEYLYRQAMIVGGVGKGGLALADALASTLAGQPEEAHAHYETHEPVPPIVLPSVPNSAALYQSALSHWSTDLNLVAKSLRNGRAVGLGLAITKSFTQPVDGIVATETNAFPGAAHAVVAVGLGQRENLQFLRIRNSWGSGWGDGGHAWLPWRYLELHTLCVYGEAAWPP
jgi:hypothetical protein